MGLRDPFGHQMMGKTGGTRASTTTSPCAVRNIGAWIMGRNMFGPIRGPWRDEAWKGWWGDNPPYHCRSSCSRTTRHADHDGGRHRLPLRRRRHPGRAERATRPTAADVRIGGGAATIQQFLARRPRRRRAPGDAPMLLGCGEHLFFGLDLSTLGYTCTDMFHSRHNTHRAAQGASAVGP